MFEIAELGQKVSKQAFEEEVATLRMELLEAQRALLRSKAAVLILVSGVEGAGKSEVVNRLTEWLDPRSVRTYAFWDETDEERNRPPQWRFWRALPPKGTIHIFFGSWYTQPIIRRVYGQLDEYQFDKELHTIEALERMLVQEGTEFAKLWFHLPKKVQAKRVLAKRAKKVQDVSQAQALASRSAQVEAVASEQAEPDTPPTRASEAGLSELAREFAERYDEFTPVSARAIQLTDTGWSAWHIVEATNKRFRDLSAGRLLLRALKRALRRSSEERPPDPPAAPVASPSGLTVLDAVDLSPRLDLDAYHARLAAAQKRVRELSWAAFSANRSLVAIFEGWDAAGKGGAIRRFIRAIDARLFRVIPIAAPSDEEKSQHYLWRFWRHIPMGGHVTVFDRTWYGRVLVERVEGFATKAEWQRSYSEINDFEERLTEHGIGLAKFWIHISEDEQLRRFEERAKIPWKKHKITEEDWRNREKWSDYATAIDDMVARTSTPNAPWHLVPGNDKRYARVQIVDTVADTIEAMLG